MHRTLEQLVNGKFEYQVKRPIVSIEKVDAFTAPGKDFRGSVTLRSPDKQRLRVIATVTNARIALESERYSGTEIIINFGIDVNGLFTGDTVTGDMIFSTNCGECILPVYVRIERDRKTTSIGEIQTTDDLAALARQDFNEAYLFFTGPGMKELAERETPYLRTIYEALSINPVTYQRLEEFLVCAGKKEPLKYLASSKQMSFLNLEDSVSEVLSIQKNTWGNVNLNVSVQGNFIDVPQKHYIAEDFVGNVLDIQYIIRYDRLMDSIQKGKILVSSDTDSFELHITASKYNLPYSRKRLKYKKNVLQLMRAFLDYHTGNISERQMVGKALEAVEGLKSIEQSVRLMLLEVYLYHLLNDDTYAGRILDELDEHDFAGESALSEAAYIYLSYKCGHSDYDEETVIDELRALFEEDSSNVMLLHMLIDMDPELQRHPGRIMRLLKNIYDRGSESPFIYLEASKVLRENPGLFETLGSFMKFVLQGMARYHLLTDDLALKAAVLSDNEKVFSRRVYDILCRAYDEFGTDELLEAICRLVIKGNPRNRAYHRWFALAVERDIRITRLYEYYMETLPEGSKEILPFKIRRYFTLNNTLGSGDKARLYANIISNKSPDEDTYEDYRERISNFAFESLQRGSVSEDLALIYSEYIRQIPTRKVAEAMSRVMFTHVLVVDDKRVREAVIHYPSLKAEYTYPVKSGKAYVDYFSPSGQILFRDERGRRFINGVHYSLKNLLDYDEYIPGCMKQKIADLRLFLHLNIDDKGNVLPVDSDNADMMLYLSKSDEITGRCRADINRNLLEYFANNSADGRGEAFIKDRLKSGSTDGNPVLQGEMLIMYGHYREAFDLITDYGYENMDCDKLLFLAGKLMEEMRFTYDEELLLLCLYVYEHGRYDEAILTYLIKHFKGLVDTMEEIRERAAGFLMDTFELDERILKTSMFVRHYTESGAEIYRNYVKEGGKPLVTEAYLIFEAMSCFLNDLPLKPYIEEAIKERIGKKDPDIVLKLALLKHYAGKGELTGPEFDTARDILDECVKKNIVFSFYKKFPPSLLGKYQLDDKLIIECKAMPGDKVMIHYRYPSMEENEYVVVPMKMVYGGIFSRSFVMFHGEKLKYYFTVNRGGESIKTDVMAKVMKVDDPEGTNLYQRINQMIIADEKGDEASFRNIYRKYRMAVNVTENLFKFKREQQ